MEKTDENTAPTISRRSFLVGTAALAGAGVLASAASLSGCKGSSEDEEVEELIVSEKNLLSFTDCKELAANDHLTLETSYTLPAGSMFWVFSDSRAVMLVPGSSSRPLSYVNFLDYFSGEQATVLAQAVGGADGFEIYEVRASDSLLLWTECNFLTSDWRVYGAAVQGFSSIGEPILFDEGNADFDAPLLCVAHNVGYWTVLPFETGAHKSDSSYLKSRRVGDSEAKVCWTSHGRLATTPERSGSHVTIAPRVDTSGIYYILTALDANSGDEQASITLPASVRPSDAIYMDGTFAYTLEASYDSTSAASQAGTYRDLGDGKWFRINRASLCTPALCNSWFVSKYGKGIVAIDTKAMEYFAIEAPDRSFDYGDFLASSGLCENIVTYATVGDQTNAASAQVVVRVWSLA